MKTYYLFAVLLILFLLGGCAISEESIILLNQKITDKYDSFSTASYTVNTLTYKNGELFSEERYSEIFKKPDKIKRVIEYNSEEENPQDFLYICNENKVYSNNKVYEYVNLPSSIETYCSFFVDNEVEYWKIPEQLMDSEKYEVEISKTEYEGIDAVKVSIKELMSEEAKQKQIDVGNEIKEPIINYWFDINSLALLKEESERVMNICEDNNCEQIRIRIEKYYEGFSFDMEIQDSEFEIDEEDIEKEIVDASLKFD